MNIFSWSPPNILALSLGILFCPNKDLSQDFTRAKMLSTNACDTKGILKSRLIFRSQDFYFDFLSFIIIKQYKTLKVIGHI